MLSSGLAFAYLLAYGLPHLASYLPGGLYLSLLALFLFPGGLLHRDSRLFFGQTLWRIATPLRPVTWADFLLADVLTRRAAAVCLALPAAWVAVGQRGTAAGAAATWAGTATPRTCQLPRLPPVAPMPLPASPGQPPSSPPRPGPAPAAAWPRR